jgi:hypothetical protein
MISCKELDHAQNHPIRFSAKASRTVTSRRRQLEFLILQNALMSASPSREFAKARTSFWAVLAVTSAAAQSCPSERRDRREIADRRIDHVRYLAMSATMNCMRCARSKIECLASRTRSRRTNNVWCGRPDSNRHGETPNGFSYHLRLSPPPMNIRRLWSGLSLHPSEVALGAARLVSTPSPVGAWLGIASKGFPDFGQFYVAGFPARTQSLKSVASTIPPRPHMVSRWTTGSGAARSGAARFSRPRGSAARRQARYPTERKSRCPATPR